MNRVAALLFTVGVLGFAVRSPALAQARTDSLPTGAHVRASVRDQNVMLSGFVRGTRDDTLLIAACRKCANTTATPLASLTSLEMERHRSAATPGSVAGGMIAGLFVGTLAGAGVRALWVAELPLSSR